MSDYEKVNLYDYRKYLNWRDDGNDSVDGQGVEDPSMNDYLKGYNMNPYDFVQWASNKNIIKHAIVEVDVLKFTPEYLADKILKLWNKSGGLLQDFYDAFTLRYSNALKKDIAYELKKQGYEVLPLLIEDRPIYAKHKKIANKIAKSNNIKNIVAYSSMLFGHSEGVSKFTNSVIKIEKRGAKVNKDNASEILDYYIKVYPYDYALRLVEVILNNPSNLNNYLDSYKDYNISDESLEAIENYMSGNADPFYLKDNRGYDFVSDMRSDSPGVMPNQYEVRLSKKKVKKNI